MKLTHLYTLLFSALIISCGDSSTTEDTEDVSHLMHEEPVTVTAEDGTETMQPEAAANLQDLLDGFTSCRDASTSRNDCRHWISKLVCDYTGIDDFMEGTEYVLYDSIRPIIERTSDWTKMGSGEDAAVLELAQKNANLGLAVVAIDVSESYGMVVLVLPGEGEKASKWGGNLVPNAACFTHVKSLKPFINKSVAYAFRTPENIVFYTRKF